MTNEPELPGIADPLTAQRQELAEVLDVCRCVMLMEPMAIDFNAIPMAGPVQRVIIAAQAVHKATEVNETLRALTRKYDVIGVLRGQATRRKTGEIVAPVALAADVSAPAERGN